jgi:hypothetical protein
LRGACSRRRCRRGCQGKLGAAKHEKGRKHFFFEKKKQKTFIPEARHAAVVRTERRKSFLVLFFKKELFLPLFALIRPAIGLGIPFIAVVATIPLLSRVKLILFGLPAEIIWLFCCIPLTALCLGICLMMEKPE